MRTTSINLTTSAFTSDNREELVVFADNTTLGATAPEESSLILTLQATTEKIFNWFDVNQPALNSNCFFIFSCTGIGAPQ